MSWLQKLYETYGYCAGNPKVVDGDNPLLPICHTTQQAHIEITIDGGGNFQSAKVISKQDATTIVPCTEASGGRAGIKPTNHPLCDKLQYVAGDFLDYGGEVTLGFQNNPKEPHQGYLASLFNWQNSSYSHPKLDAIYAYVKKGRVMSDLVESQIILLDKEKKQLLKKWAGDKKNTPPIFSVVPNGKGQDDIFVRWIVVAPGTLCIKTWEDQSLMEAWIGFYTSRNPDAGQSSELGGPDPLCLVSGTKTVLAEQHPAKLRNAADKAKLISSNDSSGFTYRGRFLTAEQACGVSFDVTQKAHNALRWLISRQGFRKAEQAIVAWAVIGAPIPDPFKNSLEMFGFSSEEEKPQIDSFQGDVGQAFGKRLSKKIAGYKADIGETTDIVVMGIDSATPGRMAITYYRELKSSEFLERIEAWHSDFAWLQNYGWGHRFLGAPSPKDISEVAYGHRDEKGMLQIDDKLQKSTVERLLTCIIDGLPMPRDLVESVIRRACNRIGLKKTRNNGAIYEYDWEKTLGIACALFKGFYLRHPTTPRSYQMILENRTSRDYLYGRLLAAADYLESQALHSAGESRDTTAAKLMQRFADRPFSTWRNIELALNPYKSRLRSKRSGLLVQLDKLLDEISCLFEGDDFLDDRKLTGEFLLGYHCQRQALWHKPDSPEPTKSNEVNTDIEQNEELS